MPKFSLLDTQRDQSFSRRAFVIGGVQGLLLTTLAGRLYYLNVMQSQRYLTLAEDNRINMHLVLPPRGRVFDRHGKPIALNRQNYRVTMANDLANDPNSILDQLSLLIDISEQDRARVIRQIRQKNKLLAVIVREDLNWEEVSRLEINLPYLAGVSVEQGLTRTYSYGAAVGHIMGYVGAISEKELAKNSDDPLYEMPDFRVGKNGLESYWEEDLRGTPGTNEVEVNAVGRVVRELSSIKGKPGDDMEITIDMDLQQIAEARLGQDSASAVVMNVHSGEIELMVSAPGFNPNSFTQGMNPEEWQELITNPKFPLTNKVIAGQYAPGSTFKMVTALAGLETGLITPQTQVNCTGTYEFGDSIFHCWNRRGHGTLSLRRALKESCDVYFYETAKRVGIDKIAAMARRFGLGSTLGIDTENERSGLIPDRSWKQKALGKPWLPGETLSCGIGQSYVQTTPLQLATMMARMVNGGAAVVPHITRLVGGRLPDGQKRAPFANIDLNAINLRAVLEGLAASTNEAGGTAFNARIIEPQWQMAGKTGSAQVRRITKAERQRGVRPQMQLPWVERDNALFVCYAPLQSPKYACCVVVEHGMHGGWVAPIARDLLIQTFKRDQGENIAFDLERVKEESARLKTAVDIPASAVAPNANTVEPD